MTSKTPPQAEVIVALATNEAQLFHTPTGDPYLRFPVDRHYEAWPVRSKGSRDWLRWLFYQTHGKGPSAQAMSDAVEQLESLARFEGTQHAVHVRLAEQDGAIFLDLGDADWHAVRITAVGWEVVTDPPVRFRRPRGLAALPVPLRDGEVADLRRFLNIGSDNDWRLLAGWLLAALRPSGPFPVLVLQGEQGSAKSTLVRVLRELVDPNASPLRAEPRTGQDLMIAAVNGWIVALDNLSGIAAWLSDAICRLSTGGGFATRKLYSDDDEILLDAERPVIVNGIDDLAIRGDLLDRAIVLQLPVIGEERRRPESEYWRDFETHRAAILGALLDVLAAAIAAEPHVRLERLPRMADFARWIVAAEPALTWPAGSFLVAYAGNRREAHDLALDASPVAALIRGLTDTWEGTAAQLLDRLTDEAEDGLTRSRAWPKSPRSLTNVLRRLAPNLRATGIDITFYREARTRRRLIAIEKARIVASPSSPSVPAVPVSVAGAEMGDATNRTGTQPNGSNGPIVPPIRAQGDAGDARDATIRPLSNGASERILWTSSDEPEEELLAQLRLEDAP